MLIRQKDSSPCRILIFLGLSLPSLPPTLSLTLPTCVYYHCYTDYHCHIYGRYTEGMYLIRCTTGYGLGGNTQGGGMGLAGIPRVRYGYHDKYHGRKYLGYSTAQSTAGTGMGLRPSYQAWYTVYTFTMCSLGCQTSAFPSMLGDSEGDPRATVVPNYGVAVPCSSPLFRYR